MCNMLMCLHSHKAACHSMSAGMFRHVHTFLMLFSLHWESKQWCNNSGMLVRLLVMMSNQSASKHSAHPLHHIC